MNEETAAARPKGLEEAPAIFRSPAPTEGTEHPPWRPEDLPGKNLRGQDLTAIKGLLPEHLAGADLTGANLPDDIANFPALAQVAAISSEARKIFIGLLAACVYSWLVIGTTTDVALILNTASSPLPIINTPIPIADFYWVAGTILAAVYCYLQFYLLRLWRTLATLPAVFPDGVSLDDKTDPWLLTGLVRTYMPGMPARPLGFLENLLSIVLAWGLVPFTLFLYWARFLPAHYIASLGWLAFLIAFSAFFGRHTFSTARATLRREMPPAPRRSPGDSAQPLLIRVWRELHVARARIFLWLYLPFVIILELTIAASLSSSRLPARLLNSVWIPTDAHLWEVEVAHKPEGWTGKEWDKVKQVHLRGRNLAFVDARRAFLANADMRGANLSGAQFQFAELQGADLSGAQLRGADLTGAQLQGADLTGAQLQGADLTGAQLEGAVLESVELQGAGLWGTELWSSDLRNAQLQDAFLWSVHLLGADLSGAQLQGATLLNVDLRGADLSYTQLQGADLSGPQLQGADLRGTMIWRAQVDKGRWELADLRGSTTEPMTDSDVDALIGEATEGIPDEERRNAAAESLNHALRTAERPTGLTSLRNGDQSRTLCSSPTTPSPSRSTGVRSDGPRNRHTMRISQNF